MSVKLNLVAASLLLSVLQTSNSCTSFLATGNNVANHIPMLTKVRDTSYSVLQPSYKDYKEDLRFFHQEGALYAYVAAMFGQGSSAGSRDFIAAGTNEKGLSITLNYATSESQLIKQLYGKEGIAKDESKIIETILSNASTIQEAKNLIVAIDQKNSLVPCILTMSDGNSGMVVEIAVDADKKIHYDFKEPNAMGYDYITNHFDTALLSGYNQVISEDSADRYNRISELFAKNANDPYTISTALRFSKDYNDGELNSIFRHASRMTYIVAGNEQQSTLFIEFTNTAQLYNRAVITLDKKFWSAHKHGDRIIDADQPYNPGPEIDKFMTY